MKTAALLTIAEAAKVIGVTRQAVRKAVDTGKLKSVTVQVPESRVTRQAAEAYRREREGVKA